MVPCLPCKQEFQVAFPSRYEVFGWRYRSFSSVAFVLRAQEIQYSQVLEHDIFWQHKRTLQAPLKAFSVTTSSTCAYSNLGAFGESQTPAVVKSSERMDSACVLLLIVNDIPCCTNKISPFSHKKLKHSYGRMKSPSTVQKHINTHTHKGGMKRGNVLSNQQVNI